ncbi:MAG: hypothetical protein RL459_1997 [Pseudomonadota bacterium]|jgi:hypothetical protein
MALSASAHGKLPTDLWAYFSTQFVRVSLKTRNKAEAKRIGTAADFEFMAKVVSTTKQ